MSNRIHSLAICALAATLQLAAGAADAAPDAGSTWRCTHNTYTDQPCAGGKTVDATDARSDADRRSADAATRRAGATADAMQRDRIRRDVQATRESSRPAVFARTPAAQTVHRRMAPAAGKKKKKGARESEFFTAHEAAFGAAGSNVASGSPTSSPAIKRRGKSGT